MTVICCVCFTPIGRGEGMRVVGRALLGGAAHEGSTLYEGMFATHRGECFEWWQRQMAAFEASLPTADDVQGILGPAREHEEALD